MGLPLDYVHHHVAIDGLIDAMDEMDELVPRPSIIASMNDNRK